MALFSATYGLPEVRVRDTGWQEIKYRVLPSFVSAFFRGALPFTRCFIRKNEYSQWYEDCGDASIRPVSVERLFYLDDLWDMYKTKEELYGDEKVDEDEGPAPTA